MVLAAAAGMLSAALLAAGLDWLLYRRLRSTGAAVLLISSVGVAFGLRAIVQFIWSPQPQYYVRKIQIAQSFYSIRIKPDQFFIVGLTVVLVLALHLFLTRTRLGKAMRAAADNMELARVTGIDTEQVILWTWLIGGALAASGGVLAGIENKFITPELGWHLLIYVFAAVILGGIGNPYGAMAGGLIIGVSSELSTLVINTVYKPVVAFVIMVIVLLFKPTGLFGSK
jgi:branched-chain amino acid transport system permease protein/neutral amino acid transport system permease protein